MIVAQAIADTWFDVAERWARLTDVTLQHNRALVAQFERCRYSKQLDRTLVDVARGWVGKHVALHHAPPGSHPQLPPTAHDTGMKRAIQTLLALDESNELGIGPKVVAVPSESVEDTARRVAREELKASNGGT